MHPGGGGCSELRPRHCTPAWVRLRLKIKPKTQTVLLGRNFLFLPLDSLDLNLRKGTEKQLPTSWLFGGHSPKLPPTQAECKSWRKRTCVLITFLNESLPEAKSIPTYCCLCCKANKFFCFTHFKLNFLSLSTKSPNQYMTQVYQQIMEIFTVVAEENENCINLASGKIKEKLKGFER